MKKSLTFVLLGLFFRQGLSQNKLSGRFIGENQQPTPYLEVTASVGDSILSGVITDTSGTFILNLPNGQYILRGTLFGKELYKKQLSLKHSLKLGVIQVKTGMQLGEVAITARKSLLEKQGDKLVMNVGGSPLLKGRNTLEILRYAPYVAVNPNTGAISMRGKPTTILIDGKRVNATAGDLNELLASFSSEEIQSIEVITNPPSEYEAAGSGGVINIITTKAKKRGLRGTTHTSLIASRFLSHKASANLAAKLSQKLSFRSFLSTDRSDKPGKEDRTETLLSPFTKYSYIRSYRVKSNYLHTSNNLSYDITPSNELGLGFWYSSSKGNREVDNDLDIESAKEETSSLGQYFFKWRKEDYDASLNYKLRLDDSGQYIKAIFDYYQSDYRVDETYENTYRNADSVLIDSNERRSHSPTSNRIASGQLDYKKPFGQEVLKAGIKYSSVDNENSTLFENQLNGIFTRDDSLTNAFHYREQIVAAYASFSVDSLLNRGISAQIGLRGEYTQGKGEIPAKNYSAKRDYMDLFPSFSLSKNLDGKHSIAFSYSRRIGRPNYSRFNPTIFYLTDFTSEVGSPELRPAYTHALELSYNTPRFNVSLYYNRIKGQPEEMLKRLSAEKLRYQWRNIDHSGIYGVSVYGNEKVTQRAALSIKASWYRKYYQSNFTDRVDNLNVAKGSFVGYIALAYALPFGFHADLSFEYNGAHIFGQYEARENHAFYGSLSKKLENGLSFYLKLIDPFDNLRDILKTSLQEVETTQIRNNYSRAVSLSVVYNFNVGARTKQIKMDNSNRELRNRTR